MGGLMATAQLGPIAVDFKVAKVPVSLLGLSMAALPFALALDRILNGVTRPFFGWVSDHIGRENTMFIAFGLEGRALPTSRPYSSCFPVWCSSPGVRFIACSSPCAATSLAEKFATANYGLLYTVAGTASLLVPLGNIMQTTTGSWLPIFIVAIAFDWLGALLAFFVLKPLRIRWVPEQARAADALAAGPARAPR